MRRLTLLVGAVALLSGPGCEWVRNLRPKPPTPTPSGKLEQKPARDLVAYLNRQSGAINTVRYDSVSLKATLPDVRWVPSLNSGLLVCGKDRNFRLQAGLPVGGDQLDIGSNPQEMWMCVRQPEPTFLTCAHADFPRVQNELPVPFEPDWLVQALGMATFPDRADYRSELDAKSRSHFLWYEERAANGQLLTKGIEFAADDVSGSVPQIRRHLVLAQTPDRRKWEIVTEAIVKQVQSVTVGTDPLTFQPLVVQVPTQLLFEWPKQKVKMELRLGDLKVNDGKTPAAMFTRPATFGGANPINLAEYRSTTARGAAPRK